MLLAEQLVRQRYVRPGPLVLGTAPIKYPAPTTDRDRTVSRRSEPSSRTALIGEQPNPWDRIQPQDAQIPWEVLGKVTSRIVNEVKGVNRVLYDCTGKPPATIEFE